jgi:hypothetical protein
MMWKAVLTDCAGAGRGNDGGSEEKETSCAHLQTTLLNPGQRHLGSVLFGVVEVPAIVPVAGFDVCAVDLYYA